MFNLYSQTGLRMYAWLHSKQGAKQSDVQFDFLCMDMILFLFYDATDSIVQILVTMPSLNNLYMISVNRILP